MKPVVLTQKKGEVSATNGIVTVRVSDKLGKQEILRIEGGKERRVFSAPFLLLQRHGGYGGLEELKGNRVKVISSDENVAIFAVEGENRCYHYCVTYALRCGDSHITGRTRFKPKFNQVGWFCYGLETAKDDNHWCYPWISGKTLRLPTVIGRSIGVTRPNHIWTALTGIPAIVGRGKTDCYCLGFPVDFDYRDASLTYNNELENRIRLSLGIRRAKGTNIEDSVEEYLKTADYSFPFQICAVKGDFPELAREWIRANAFTTDTAMKHTPEELEAIFVSAREKPEYLGARKYIREEKEGRKISGYVHGSDDTRIGLLKTPRNAYVDYMLYQKTGNKMWRDRSFNDIAFFVDSQSELGALRENWDFTNSRYYFQGFDEFGFHPDQQAYACEYLYRVWDLVKRSEGEDKKEWLAAADRLAAWLLSLMEEDGAISQTVISTGKSKGEVVKSSAGNQSEGGAFAATDRKPGEPAPMSRLLVAFSTIHKLTGREDIKQAMLKHEAWLVKHAYVDQHWWGHLPDTNMTTCIYAALKFVEYCVVRYEDTKDGKYLEWGSITAYWCFFQTLPKHLEGLRQYTRGAVLEQDNYMQMNSAVADNLILSSLEKLSQYTSDPFLHDLARQYYQTAAHAASDDPRHPWYGSANMYVADPLGLTVPFDTDPATGGATKYFGTIVNTLLEDIWAAKEAGLFK